MSNKRRRNQKYHKSVGIYLPHSKVIGKSVLFGLLFLLVQRNEARAVPLNSMRSLSRSFLKSRISSSHLTPRFLSPCLDSYQPNPLSESNFKPFKIIGGFPNFSKTQTRSYIPHTYLKSHSSEDEQGNKLDGVSFKPEFAYLSPSMGFAAIESGALRGMYLQGKNPFQENDPDKELVVKDTQPDPTIRLIREMFYQIPETETFGPTVSVNNPVTYFTPEILGKILDYISRTSFSDLRSEDQKNNWTKGISEIISPCCNGTSIAPKQIKRFSRMLLDSILNCKNGHPIYSINQTEEILLGFFWGKFNSKEDIRHLMIQMPHALTESSLFILDSNSEKTKRWLNAEFSQKDFEKWRSKKKEQQIEHLTDLHLGPFLATSAVPAAFNLPVLERQTYVPVENENSERFPDCVETSILNLIKILLHKNQRFDSDLLNNIKIQYGMTPKPDLVKYLEKYSDFSKSNLPGSHNDWSGSVVAKIPGVNYRSSGYEVDSGLTNILKVIEDLLFSGSDTYKRLPNNASKLDYICKAFSRPNLELSWDKSKNLTDYPQLKFFANGKPIFNFHVGKWHAEVNVEGINNKAESNNDVAISLAHHLSEHSTLSGGAPSLLLLTNNHNRKPILNAYLSENLGNILHAKGKAANIFDILDLNNFPMSKVLDFLTKYPNSIFARNSRRETPIEILIKNNKNLTINELINVFNLYEAKDVKKLLTPGSILNRGPLHSSEMSNELFIQLLKHYPWAIFFEDAGGNTPLVYRLTSLTKDELSDILDSYSPEDIKKLLTSGHPTLLHRTFFYNDLSKRFLENFIYLLKIAPEGIFIQNERGETPLHYRLGFVNQDSLNSILSIYSPKEIERLLNIKSNDGVTIASIVKRKRLRIPQSP